MTIFDHQRGTPKYGVWSRLMNPPDISRGAATLQAWRMRVLQVLLVIGAVLGLVALSALTPMLLAAGSRGLLSIGVAAYLLMLALLFLRNLPYDLRAGAGCLTIYLLGLSVITHFGPFSGGPAFLFCFSVLAGILLGIRGALTALSLNFVTILALVWFLYHGFFAEQWALLAMNSRWIMAGISFLFLNSLATLSVTILVKGLAESMREGEKARRELEAEVRQRAEAEMRLAESESYYRTTLEYTGTAMLHILADGTISRVNARFEELSGLPRREIEGRMRWQDFVAPADLPRMVEYHRQRLAQGQPPTEYEFLFQDSAGGLRDMIIIVQVIPGTRVSVASLLDISERKKIESALAASELHYRTLLGVLPDPVVVYDKDGRVAYINEAFVSVYGWTLDEIAGGMIPGFVPEEELEKTRQAWEKQIQINQAAFRTNRRSKDGRVLTVEIRGVSLMSPEGEYQGAIVTHRDVTEAQQAALALKASEEKFARAFHQSPVWVVLSSLEEGLYLDVNDAFLETTGFTAEEVLGRTSLEVGTWADRSEREMVVDTVKREGAIRNAQVHRLTKSGDILTMLFSGERVTIGDRDCLLSVSQDITDLKAVEERYRRSEEQFRKAFHGAPTGMALVGLDRRLMQVNRLVTETLGYTEAEMVGKSFNEFTHPDYHEGGRERYRRMGEGLEDHTQAEKRYLRKDGDVVWTLTSNSVVRDDQGRPSHVVCHLVDITERKRAEAALRESEERFRLSFHTNPDSININRKRDGVYVDVNDGFCQMTGYSREEVIGRTALELDLWGDQEDNRRFLDCLRRNEVVQNLEARFRLKNGSLRTCLMSARNITLGGEPHIITITRDIDEWKKAEDAWRRSEERARAILESSPDPVVVYDHQGKTIYMNPAFTRVFGWTLEELGGRQVPFVPSDEQDRTIRMIRKLYENGVGGSFAARRLTKDGRLLDVMISAAGVQSDTGAVSGMVVNITDLTERTNMERALVESERRYRELVDNITDFIYTHDLDGRFLSVNRAACKTLGYSPEEIIGRPVSDIMPPDHRDNFQREYLGGLLRDGSYQGLNIYLGKDGGRHYLEYRSELVREDGREPFVRGSAREVTDRIMAERDQRKLEEQLFQAQKMEALGTLTGGVAHDFNNLLSAIMGNLDLARAALEDKHPSLRYLVNAASAADRAAMVTKQLLITARRAARDIRPVDMGRVVEETTHLLSETIDRRISLVTDVALNLWPVRADEAQMSQVIMNLCVNARDAILEVLDGLWTGVEAGMREPFIRVSARNWQSGPETDGAPEVRGYVEVSVSDTGCGIPPEVMDRIYDPFFTTKILGEGTGLGLSTVYGIVKQHDGTLEVDSEPGRGSTFRLRLPAETAAPDAARQDAAPVEPLGGSERILAVDDETDILSIAREALERLGYQVFTAQDGEEAWSLFLDHKDEIDLVLMDLSMPRLSGQQVAERILEIRPDVKMIISSGHSQTELDSLGHLSADGNLAYLHKPYGLKDLARQVRRLLDA